MDKNLVAWIFIAMIGAAFIGKGLTGFAIVSQSCCFSGEKCSAQDRCENVGFDYGQYDVKSDILHSIAGLAVIFVSLMVIRSRIHHHGIK